METVLNHVDQLVLFVAEGCSRSQVDAVTEKSNVVFSSDGDVVDTK